MSQKRRNGEAVETTGRERKKLKINAAREITVQASSSKQVPDNVAGPSRVIPTSLNGLPSTIDVEKFVEARAFEIDAMHTAMKTASASSTHRVWQTLPRHLRRRAASHDVRRVPLRLRERAAAEMDAPKAKTGPTPSKKKGKAGSQSRTEILLKRQVDKTWLETHMWHAKRMHMENMWGYRLAVSPTDKCYRPSLRAVQNDSIIHDASYYSMVELEGPERLVVSLLELCCDPQNPGPGSKRYLNGSRVYQTHVYTPGTFPLGLIGPMTILWRPVSNKESGTQPATGTQMSTQHTVASSSSSTRRSAWLRFHPSVHLDVMEALKAAASSTLASHQSQNPGGETESLDIIDLKGRLNVFEIMGPKSSQVIKGALSPASSDKRQPFRELWRSLKSLRSAGSLPRGMVIGCTVDDPRLKFPPKNAHPDKRDTGTMVLPSPSLAESDIWEDSIRSRLKKPKYKQADLDARRSKNPIPGTSLQVLRQDDRVPILLIQHSWESSEDDDAKALHGWMIIVPEGWSMPFFSSLVFTGSRVAGQHERQTQVYEAGLPYFPRDYPCTTSYTAYAEEQADQEKALWDKKPPAKRPNYDALGTKNPWQADWDAILGIQSSNPTSEYVPTQREPQESVQPVQRWLLRGPEVRKIVSNLFSVFNHGTSLVTDLNSIRLKRGWGTLSRDIKPASLLQGALVNVRLTMCSRGTPDDLAMVYLLSDDRVKQWKRLLDARKSKEVLLEETKEEELAGQTDGAGSMIGSVTTGHFSFLRGQGFAIGAVSLTSIIQLKQQYLRLRSNANDKEDLPKFIVAIRNGNGKLYRAAYLEVI